jgi:hypothetical protein
MLRRNPAYKERYVVILVDDQGQKAEATHPLIVGAQSILPISHR